MKNQKFKIIQRYMRPCPKVVGEGQGRKRKGGRGEERRGEKRRGEERGKINLSSRFSYGILYSKQSII